VQYKTTQPQGSKIHIPPAQADKGIILVTGLSPLAFYRIREGIPETGTEKKGKELGKAGRGKRRGGILIPTAHIKVAI